MLCAPPTSSRAWVQWRFVRRSIRPPLQGEPHELTLAADLYDLEAFLRAHVRDVDGGERVIGDEFDEHAGHGARQGAPGEERRQRTFEAPEIQHFRSGLAIVIHCDSS